MAARGCAAAAATALFHAKRPRIPGATRMLHVDKLRHRDGGSTGHPGTSHGHASSAWSQARGREWHNACSGN
eukprot:15191164-Alexandrium_andersonii.AAC.1